MVSARLGTPRLPTLNGRRGGLFSGPLTVDRYRSRKVLVPEFPGRASMTVARFVPWGIQPEEGLRVSALARHLGIRRDDFGRLLRRLGMRTWHEPAAPENRRTSPNGKRFLISEEDAARVIVRFRARAGRRILRARLANPSGGEGPPSPEAPPPESTAE